MRVGEEGRYQGVWFLLRRKRLPAGENERRSILADGLGFGRWMVGGATRARARARARAWTGAIQDARGMRQSYFVRVEYIWVF